MAETPFVPSPLKKTVISKRVVIFTSISLLIIISVIFFINFGQTPPQKTTYTRSYSRQLNSTNRYLAGLSYSENKILINNVEYDADVINFTTTKALTDADADIVEVSADGIICYGNPKSLDYSLCLNHTAKSKEDLEKTIQSLKTNQLVKDAVLAKGYEMKTVEMN